MGGDGWRDRKEEGEGGHSIRGRSSKKFFLCDHLGQWISSSNRNAIVQQKGNGDYFLHRQFEDFVICIQRV